MCMAVERVANKQKIVLATIALIISLVTFVVSHASSMCEVDDLTRIGTNRNCSVYSIKSWLE